MSETARQEDQGQVVPVIHTQFPGVVVLEVNHEHGRYLWFETQPEFRIVFNSSICSSGWITSRGQRLNGGMYVNYLPGDTSHGREEPLPSWTFAHELYSSLGEQFGHTREEQALKFTVFLVVIRSTGATTVNFSSGVGWIDSALRHHLGLSRNPYAGIGIARSRQNSKTINKVRRFLRDVWGAYHDYISSKETAAEVLTRFRSRGILLVPIRTIEVHPGLFIDEYNDGSLWVRGVTRSGREVDWASNFVGSADNLARVIREGRFEMFS